jgi:hypothetical protein
MAEVNPYLDEEVAQSPLLTRGQPPQVPISGPNPYEPIATANAPHPSTLLGNTADVAKAASNTFTFGGTDRLIGLENYLIGASPSYSEGVNQAVADTAMRRERSPYLSLAGDVGGGVAQAYVPGLGVVGKTASAAMGGAQAGLRGTAARVAGYGLEGGLLGAGQAAGHTYSGEPVDYAKAALAGGAFGSILGAPFGKFADVSPQSLAAIPKSPDLFVSSRGHYQNTHMSPMRYDASMMRGGLDAFENDLQSPAYGVVKVPDNKTFAVIDYLRNLQPHDPAGYSPYEIDAARKQLTGVKDPGASQMRAWLDNYMISPHGVSAGTPTDQALVTHWLDLARGDYRAGKRTQAVEEANQYAGDRAEVANSGRNVANTYGQKLSAKFLNPSSPEYKWSTPDERAAVRSAVTRDWWGNVPRVAGNMLGGGGGAYTGALGVGGLGTAFMSGDLKPAVAGVAIPAAGWALKSADNRAMVAKANELADTFAKNSPLYRSRAANAPTVEGPGLGNFAESNRNAITMQLLNQLKLRGYLSDPTNQEQP